MHKSNKTYWANVFNFFITTWSSSSFSASAAHAMYIWYAIRACIITFCLIFSKSILRKKLLQHSCQRYFEKCKFLLGHLKYWYKANFYFSKWQYFIKKSSKNFCKSFFSLLPHKESHGLSLEKDSPNQQFVKRIIESAGKKTFNLVRLPQPWYNSIHWEVCLESCEMLLFMYRSNRNFFPAVCTKYLVITTLFRGSTGLLEFN